MPLRWPDLILILAVVVIIFAAGKIPEISGGLRRTMDNLWGRQSAFQTESEPPGKDPGDPVENAPEAQAGKTDSLV